MSTSSAASKALEVLEVSGTAAVPDRNAMRIDFSDGSSALTWWKWKHYLKCDQLDGEEPPLTSSPKAAIARKFPNDIVT